MKIGEIPVILKKQRGDLGIFQNSYKPKFWSYLCQHQLYKLSWVAWCPGHRILILNPRAWGSQHLRGYILVPLEH